MSRKNKKVFTTMSLFCGCGGEYTGKIKAIKRLMPFANCQFFALNHNDIAVSTLSHNFMNNFGAMPLAYVEGIEKSSAKLYGIHHLDMLWASPSCTHHSNARGGKPREEQERAHIFEVYYRWLDPLYSGCIVDVFLMENVTEFVSYGPLLEKNYIETRKVRRRSGKDKGKVVVIRKVHKAGQPDPCRKGEYFDNFIGKLQNLGYTVEWRVLCSADFGDPTTRKRLFLQAVKDEHGIKWPEPTHRDPRIPLEKLSEPQRTLPTWKTAREHVIDWTQEGDSIFYRERYKKKPLVTNTLRRIKHGLKKYGLRSYFDYHQGRKTFFETYPDAYGIVYHGGSDTDRRVLTLDAPISTADTSNRIALIEPFISKGYAGNYNGPGESIEQPIPTITAIGEHNQLISSYLIQEYGWQTRRGEGGVSLDRPFPTLATAQHHPLVEPCLIVQKGQSNSSDPNTPIGALTTKQNHAILDGFCISIDHQSSGDKSADLDTPLSVITTKQRHAGIRAFLVSYYSAEANRGEGAASTDLPLPTTTAGGNHHGLVNSFIVKSSRTHSDDRRVENIDRPVSSLISGNNDYRIAQPCLVQYNGASDSVEIDRPLPTATTDDRFGLVNAYLVEHCRDQNTQQQVSSVFTPSIIGFVSSRVSEDRKRTLKFVQEREGGIGNLPIIRTEAELDAHDLLRPFALEIAGEIYLLDITLRMLTPKELAKATGFPDNFEFRTIGADGSPGRELTIKESVYLIGNAVTVGLAEALVYAVEKPRIEAKGYKHEERTGKWVRNNNPTNERVRKGV